MATKEDILEQVVEEYLLHKGYFVQHNIKYKPDPNHPDFISNQDSNHSDIDVIGYHPTKTGLDKVIAVSCKSWQGGFNPRRELDHIINSDSIRGRAAWKGFRELVVPKWSEAFLKAIEEASGRREFTYFLAVTKVNGDRSCWENHQPFQDSLEGNKIKLLDFSQMVREIYPNLGTTLASTEVGRLLQLFKASGINIDQQLRSTSHHPPHDATTSPQSLVVELIPADKKAFITSFIKNGKARITRHYIDGRGVKHSIWQCTNFGVDSDPFLNIRSRSEFRSRKWVQDGIEKIVVEVLVE